MKKFLAILIFGLLLSSNTIGSEIELKNKDYVEIEGDLKNPDRGWYVQLGHNHNIVYPYEISDLGNTSLYRIYFSLKKYQNKEIEIQTIERFKEILIQAKKYNVKIIPQFYYHWGDSKDRNRQKLYPKKIKNGKWISPSEKLIFKHVEQISKIINQP